jgi:hypothetical protein
MCPHWLSVCLRIDACARAAGCRPPHTPPKQAKHDARRAACNARPAGLPKTRSGKIMRRILRKIAAGQLDQLGDTSTLAEPGVVDQLIASRPQPGAAARL